MTNRETTSYRIISECLKEHGKGKFFARSDGLEFEARRAELRRDYLENHPQTSEEHRDAIMKAAVMPGMTKAEATAAWGLLEEDTRTAFGHVTIDRQGTFGYFTGFKIGDSCALYFRDEFVLGVRWTDELVSPHEHELTMRLTEEYRGLYYFYENGLMRGCDGYDDIRWSAAHFPGVRREIVTPWPVTRIEQHIQSKDLFPEYEAALEQAGLNRDSLSATDCERVALDILPYPPVPQELLHGDVFDEDGTPIKPRWAQTPPEAWFWHIAAGHPSQAKFPTGDGRLETVLVHWVKEDRFVVNGVPLRVDGVSQFDRIDVKWLDGDPIPHFAQVVENLGYRTVRVTSSDPETNTFLERFVKSHLEKDYAGRYKLENGVLAFTIPESRLSVEFNRALWNPGVDWIHTDTLTRE